jgi:putative tricarboxylic transport membrane protein
MAMRMNKIVPYVIVLAIVSYLYFLAAKIDFVAPRGRIGPDFWPKVILALAMATCAYEIVKSLFFGKADRDLEGVLASVLKDAPMQLPAAAPEEKTHPHLLWIGIAMTVAYAVLIEKLGFFLCTLIYLAAFMWIGRYRRLSVIVITSLVGSLAFMFMFMKIVYVSLPLGAAPFSQVSFLLMRLMGIR